MERVEQRAQTGEVSWNLGRIHGLWLSELIERGLGAVIANPFESDLIKQIRGESLQITTRSEDSAS